MSHTEATSGDDATPDVGRRDDAADVDESHAGTYVDSELDDDEEPHHHEPDEGAYVDRETAGARHAPTDDASDDTGHYVDRETADGRDAPTDDASDDTRGHYVDRDD